MTIDALHHSHATPVLKRKWILKENGLSSQLKIPRFCQHSATMQGTRQYHCCRVHGAASVGAVPFERGGAGSTSPWIATGAELEPVVRFS